MERSLRELLAAARKTLVGHMGAQALAENIIYTVLKELARIDRGETREQVQQEAERKIVELIRAGLITRPKTK
jgi:hypothetical protein